MKATILVTTSIKAVSGEGRTYSTEYLLVGGHVKERGYFPSAVGVSLTPQDREELGVDLASSGTARNEIEIEIPSDHPLMIRATIAHEIAHERSQAAASAADAAASAARAQRLRLEENLRLLPEPIRCEYQGRPAVIRAHSGGFGIFFADKKVILPIVSFLSLEDAITAVG